MIFAAITKINARFLGNKEDTMKKISLISTLILGLVIVSQAQIRFTGLPNNPELLSQSSQNEQFRKNAGIKEIHTHIGGQLLIRVEDLTAEDYIGFNASLQQDPTLGSIMVIGDSIIYTAGNSEGQDTLSVELTLEEETLNIQRLISIRSSLDIPWMDDFSYVNIAKGRPFADNWLDKTVYVNDHLAYHPPSLGVASFDGLDESGNPYNTGWGSSDTLTSTFFDLSSYSEFDDVYLSFVFQPMGLSFSPEQRDRFVLEFRDKDGNWLEVFSRDTPRLNISNPVNPTYWEIWITDADFFHSGFQFRFRNYGPKSGFINFWHLDYVRLIPNFTPTDFTLINEDIALGHSPYTLFKEHTAIPLKQFLADPGSMIPEEIRVDIINHRDRTDQVNDGIFTVHEVLSDQNILNNGTLPEGIADGAPINNIPPNEYKELQSEISSGTRNILINNLSQTLQGVDEAILTTQFRLNTDNEEPAGVFPSLAQNGIANSENYLAGYYAYDDGTAELNLELSGGSRIATRFEMKVEDTLTGVLLFLPLIDTDLSSNNFSIEIRVGSLNDTSIYEDGFAQVVHSNIYDVPNFSYYEIKEDLGDGKGLRVPQGDLYVIIRSQQNILNLGFDRQMNSGVNQYARVPGDDWYNFDEAGVLAGSIMLRPVFESYKGTVASQQERPSFEGALVYPNPTSTYFKVNEELYGAAFKIVNELGQVVMEGEASSSEIEIHHLSPGLYVVEFQKDETHLSIPLIKAPR